MIAAVVEQKKPVQGEKGQYGYVRQPEERPKKVRKKRGRNAEQANTDEEHAGTSGTRNGSEHSEMVNLLGMPGMSDMIPQMVSMYPPLGGPLSTSGPFDGPPVNNSPAEEEMDETEEGGDWAVRIGNEPPPDWAKPRVDGEELHDHPNKRQRTMSVRFSIHV